MPLDHDKRPHATSGSAEDDRRLGMNGRRLGLNELNLGAARGGSLGQGRWSRFVRGVQQFLAGMYTGESCAGTPRDEHNSEPAPRVHHGSGSKAPDSKDAT